MTHLPAAKSYSVGTLSYSVTGLVVMMAWLLGGDFCFQFMETVLPCILPLKLKSLEAPNWVIALFMTTIPAAVSAVICPIIGLWSDRHRSPLGRRIPFILFTIPFLVLFLLLIGLTPVIASLLVKWNWVSQAQVPALIMFGFFTTGFQVFNMVVASVYYYLFNDVVPQPVIGRFLTAFRFVGVIATAFFSYLIFPKAESHFMEILVGTAIFYAVVFFVMCFRVKEGGYPEPVPRKDGDNVWTATKSFFVESYSSRYYWYFYLFVGFWHIAGTIGVFSIFFAKSVEISLEQLGEFSAVLMIASALLLLPFGYLSDRFHPIRTIRVACVLLVLVAPLPLVFAFGLVPPQWTFVAWCVVNGVTGLIMALFTASEMPIYMKILPRDRFGQFSAATALVRSLALMIGGTLSGLFIDGMRVLGPDPNFAYRYIPIWVFLFQGLATVFLCLLYREWKKRGDAVA